MVKHQISCGDIVWHAPSGEEWVVAWAEPKTDELAWCGWPNGVARLSDCTLAKAATDGEHGATLSAVLRSGDSRAVRAERLYGHPERPAPARKEPT